MILYYCFKCKTLRLLLLLVLSTNALHAHAQCNLLQIANPSFEVGSDNTLEGWNQFGVIEATNVLANHGNRAAQLSGTNSGTWSLSAVWQKQTASEGDIWQADLTVGHTSSNPITGNMKAIVNIEWRDSEDNLISFTTTEVATASTAADTLHAVSVTSDPAPANTASTHILIGLLQTPSNETGAVIIDSVSFVETTGAQLADIQWGDFPSGRTVNLGDYSWRVKGSGYYGPGPNHFFDTNDQVWVDENDRLHMTIKNRGQFWSSSEIAAEEIMGYGDYRLTVVGRLDDWAPNVVFGFFHWQYPFCYNDRNPWNLHNEMDMEISRWGDPSREPAHFIVQPWQDYIAEKFDLPYTGDPEQLTTFAYEWLSDRIIFRAWRGDALSESEANMIHQWTYTGPHIPREEVARMHLNLWQFYGPPSDGQEYEIILSDFVFVADGTPPPETIFNVPFNHPLYLFTLASMIFIVNLSRRKKVH